MARPVFFRRTPERQSDAPLDLLAPREVQALVAIAHGLKRPEIAAEMGIAPRTVQHYVTSILRKVGGQASLDALRAVGFIVVPPEVEARVAAMQR